MHEAPDIEFAIAGDQLCFVIVKAREFEVKEWPALPSEGSNPSDDKMVEVLESRRNDPVFAELRSFINGLDEDRQIDLVTLAWIGRGDYGIDEWEEARKEAAAAHNNRTAEYLLGMPLLSEFLEDAWSEAGRSCEDEEMGRL